MDTTNSIPNLANLPRTIGLSAEGGATTLTYLDQRELPGRVIGRTTSDWREVVDAIKTLAVRGAPAIGVAGAAAVALWCAEHAADSDGADAYLSRLASDSEAIASARPTAVNLRWGVHRVADAVRELAAHGASGSDIAQAAAALVKDMEREDEAVNRAIGAAGAELIEPGSHILTHCNAGSLATVFYGTALGVVYAAAAQGKVERVYSDETRPVGQGARLTVWELSRAGVPVTLICDDMAASLMAQGAVQAVVVGADRIARNGDTANKIGTLGVAVLAHEFGVPFYVAAPFSTIDASLADGSGIPIEQRAPEEVLPQPIEGVDVWNPAFDVTPARYISKIVTEKGAFAPEELAGALAQG